MSAQRGSVTLFNDVFVKEEAKAPVTSRKGRSPELVFLRNECLVARYYFYGKFTDKRYNKILEELEKEFYLSQVTIPEIIAENYEFLEFFKTQTITVEFFRSKWPHLVWLV